MTQPTALLLKANLKQLKLPTMLAECEKLAREAVANSQPYEDYLLRLTEQEVAARSANALAARIRAAAFPVHKDFDTYDFSALPGLPKQKVLELARGDWLEQRYNCCLIGNAGTGKTHLATALGPAACRQGKRVRFFTAAGLVTQLEEAQQGHRLDRSLGQLDRADLLICDELGYLSFSRAGAELLFQVFADRYERRSLLITSNLAFGDWGSVFQGERMTAALLDRLTHRCHIFEMNGESYRFKESMKGRKDKDAKKTK
ncbi:MAG TPA: IS21-like element helper ATPase IstB [Gemmataceae bacterium]|jgi:DNA replication protein DnaC|nr:IS21-like element helper ATPase IstB [Gemmataceae bacterium]